MDGTETETKVAPSFVGMWASVSYANAITTADGMLACEEFTKLVICG